jgi:hypothetical protein
MGSKAKAQRRHARRRAYERFLVEWSERDLDAIVRIIQRGDSELIERQSLRVSKRRVTYDGLTVVVVYDRLRKTIVTVLYEEDGDTQTPTKGRGDDLDRAEGDEAPRHAADAGIGVSHVGLDGPVGHDHGGAASERKPALEGDRASDPSGAAQLEQWWEDEHRVRVALAELYLPEGVEIWLKAPNKLLAGEVPLDLIWTGDVDRVLALIDALADGVVM